MPSQLLGRIGMRAFLLGLSTFCSSLAAQTSDPPTPASISTSDPRPPERGSGTVPVYVEYDKRVRASEQLPALGSELFGDEMSLYLGQTTFRHVDIDIPGNNELPVQLSRRFTIGALTDNQQVDPRGGPGNPYGGLANWDIEAPHIYGTFDETFKWNIPATSTTQQPRCSQYFGPRHVSPALDVSEVWSGNKVVIPGQGEKELLLFNPSYPPLQYPSDGRPPTWTTSDFDAFRCIPLSGVNNEGFVMTTRAGVSYRFDKYFERTYPTVGSGNFSNARVAVYLLASRVTDRHGNWVDYTYNGDGHPTAITASDGRAITLAYSQQRLQSASVTLSAPAETRTWIYSYASDNLSDNLPRLTTVTLPDNLSTWQFDYRALNTPDPKTGRYKHLYVKYVPPDLSGKECAPVVVDGSGALDFGLRITHPSGSRGDFRFAFERADRFPPKSLPNCEPRAGGGRYYIPPHIDTFRLKSKQISDTDTTSSLWTYDYDTLTSSSRVRTTIKPPDGSEINHDFSAAAKVTEPGNSNNGLPIEGQLVSVTTVKGSDVLRQLTNTYVIGVDTAFGPLAGYPFPSIYGGGSGGDPSANSLRPLLSTEIVQQGVRFKRTNLSFDPMGRPLQVKRESALVGGSVLHTKTETTVYDDRRPIWVLDLVDTVTDSTQPSSPVVDNNYDGLGNLLRVAAFNREQRTMTWGPDGTLLTVKVGPNTTTVGVPKRGIPQSVTYADTTSISATIDDAGDIRAVTDENSYTTNYGYDRLRRLTSITYPTNDTVAWASTTIQYDRVGTEVDIFGTHWRQTTSTGNARKIVHYDQRLRPRLTQVFDTANVLGTQRYVRRGFDFANRETFVSFPSTSSSVTTGTNTTYDALGRVTGTAQDSELDTLTTETNYIAPFTTQFINARDKITTTTFQAFDEPDTSAPMTISEPLAVTTAYTRDVFGKPLTLTRSGFYSSSPISQTRQYVYDPNQLLCKTIEAESGATVLSYNASNLVEWKASGQTLTDPANCQTLSVAASQKINYDYDQRDRLWRTRYGDGSPSVTIGFELDGLPKTVQSDNSIWTTLYNKRRLMTSETLNLGGVNYPLGYTHTANGHVASLSYPDGMLAAYAPNALGEATQVGNYASQITRHPNGALKNLTYGNGIVHATEQNLRGLPSRSHDVGVLDDRYVYDENANVKSITDVQLDTNTRTMDYDDRDRLTSAINGPRWGGAHTFDYDPLDNLRRSVNPTFGDWTYVYNATTRRLDRIDPTGGGAAVLTYGYDTRGRATSRALAGTSQTFVVDLADRVTSVGPPVATYRYDGHGRRTSVTKTGTTTVQVYSQGGQLVYQSAPASDGIFRSGFQSSDTPYPPPTGGNRRYVYLGRHLIAEDGTAGRSYIHTDGLGSPARTTSASSVPSAREDYKPYGWGAEPQSKPGFTGHVADAETGLIYMQARYYDPYAGRFLAVDPVVSNPTSFNRYWYANNNPYKNIDPDGRDSASCYTGNGCGGSNTFYASRETLGAIVDFAPIVGDIKGVVEAIQEPTLVNITAAAVGLFGPLGDGYRENAEDWLENL
jgi:RHS repeat-associated protein